MKIRYMGMGFDSLPALEAFKAKRANEVASINAARIAEEKREEFLALKREERLAKAGAMYPKPAEAFDARIVIPSNGGRTRVQWLGRLGNVL